LRNALSFGRKKHIIPVLPLQIVAVDLIEIVTILFTTAIVMALLGGLVMFLIMPAPARTITIGKRLKFGSRDFTFVLDTDNNLTPLIGNPKKYGIKTKKNKFLVPRGTQDLVNKRMILSGTGIPCYIASTRTGLATGGEFLEVCQEVAKGEVVISPSDELKEHLMPPGCSTKDCDGKLKVEKGKDQKGNDVLKGWKCDECNAVYAPIEYLNPHILAAMAEENYDPTLMEAIEGEARQEALREAPGWFKWIIIAALFLGVAGLVFAMPILLK
jgi:hypothetical protein